jgi:hypothetical protein
MEIYIMSIRKLLTCSAVVLASLLPSLSQAQYVHFETPDAHIIVARPMDRWSTDKRWQTSSVQSHFDALREIRLEGFYRRDTSGKAADEIDLRKGKDRVSEVLRANMAARNLKPSSGALLHYEISAPVALGNGSLAEFQETKAKNYVAWASVQSPGVGERNASITNGVTGAVEIGAGLFATVLTGGVDLTGFFSGALGAVKKAGNMTFHVGRQWEIPVGHFVPALPVTGFDFGPYKQVDHRSISLGRSSSMLNGEVFIAYKNEKTAQAEDDALIVALTEVLAINSTKDQILAARQKEFDLRAKIWGDCLASGACKE